MGVELAPTLRDVLVAADVVSIHCPSIPETRNLINAETLALVGDFEPAKIEALVGEHFDLRPAAILHDLDLRRPIYAKTAAYGHFGRDYHDFTWERTDKAELLREAAGFSSREKQPA